MSVSEKQRQQRILARRKWGEKYHGTALHIEWCKLGYETTIAKYPNFQIKGGNARAKQYYQTNSKGVVDSINF